MKGHYLVLSFTLKRLSMWGCFNTQIPFVQRQDNMDKQHRVWRQPGELESQLFDLSVPPCRDL